VTQSSSPISGVAERYAGSLFDLALEAGAVAKVEADLGRFAVLLDGSADLDRLIKSPVFSGEDQERAISAIADKAKITGLTGNFLRLVARNRRLFALRRSLADRRPQVKVGSQLIDSSLKTKLAAMKIAMKEVG
jgi:F-type H+-transporting ATPase subunit delta